MMLKIRKKYIYIALLVVSIAVFVLVIMNGILIYFLLGELGLRIPEVNLKDRRTAEEEVIRSLTAPNENSAVPEEVIRSLSAPR